MRILLIAYPLQPVGAASCGGAEQVLWAIERELHRRGLETTVAACEGSEVSGELVVTGGVSVRTDAFAERELWHRERVMQLLRTKRFDIIHDHSGHFWPHAGETDVPVLATLHLPRSFYEEQSFTSPASNVFFSCVSDSQRESFADMPNVVGVVRNGVPLDQLLFSGEKSGYLLWLGRICPEKAPHIAIDIAKQVQVPLIVAGQVYPFSYHQEYFEREVRPRLRGAGVTFVGSPPFKLKLRLLQHARAVLITSLAHETSSMVALEAQACGTPVVARRVGALPEVVADELTGLLVNSDEEFASAINEVDRISSTVCRTHILSKFTAERMADAYERVFSEIVGRRSERPKAA